MAFSLPTEFKFSTLPKIIPDAYHGTSVDGAKGILNGNYIPARGDSLHLGDGVYFYDGCFESAAWWARKYKKFDPHVVLRSEVALSKCIDLDNRQHKLALSQFASHINQRRENSAAVRAEIGPLCDGLIINLAARLSSADTVRGSYIESEYGKKLHDWSKFAWGSRRVICVRNTNMISGTVIAQN